MGLENKTSESNNLKDNKWIKRGSISLKEVES